MAEFRAGDRVEVTELGGTGEWVPGIVLPRDVTSPFMHRVFVEGITGRPRLYLLSQMRRAPQRIFTPKLRSTTAPNRNSKTASGGSRRRRRRHTRKRRL